MVRTFISLPKRNFHIVHGLIYHTTSQKPLNTEKGGCSAAAGKGEDMEDLISRSAVKEEIESLTMIITGLRSGKGILRDFMNEYKKSVLKIIDEQPTAYNMDKVVDQLEKADSVKCYGSRNSGNYLIPLKDAMEIVKAGGK